LPNILLICRFTTGLAPMLKVMIEKYLRLLLLQHDQVVVEQLGTFTAQYENSRVSEDGREIAPPRKIITFSNVEKGDHELLRQALMQGENLSPAEYEKELAEFQEKIQYQLANLGKYEMEGLGMLFRADGGGIGFEQASHAALLPDSFGLPLLNRKKLYSNTQNKTESTTSNPPKKVEAVDKKKSSELVWWLVIIPLVFLLAFVGFLFSQKDAFSRFKAFFGGSQQETPLANNNTPILSDSTANNVKDSANNSTAVTDNNANKDTDSQPVADTKTTETNTDANKDSKPAPVYTPPANAETDANGITKSVRGRSYIIAGSFSDLGKAKKMCQNFQNDGYSNAKVIYSVSQKTYRVTLDENDDLQAATSRMGEFASKVQNLWVMQYK